MENAAKALMIAGGILLAILIVSAGVYVWQQNANFSYELEQQEEAEKIIAFNQQYESYQRQALRGIDVLTVINKVRDNNIRNSQVQELQITWNVKLRDDFKDEDSQTILKKGVHSENTTGSVFTQILDNKELADEFKRLYFKCSSLEYSKTGRVNKISFEQYTNVFDR